MNKNIIKYSLVSILLYSLAMIIPIFGFMLPSYKIKNALTFTLKEYILTNIIIIAGIGATGYKNVLIYVSVFLTIEIMFHVFKYAKIKKSRFKIFDRMVITSIISTILIVIFMGLLKTDILEIKKLVEDMYVNNYKMSETDLKLAFNFIRDYKYFLIYTYVGLMTHLTYLSMGKKHYGGWNISYIWVLFYIIPFIGNKYFGVDSLLLQNMLLITKISYIVYAAKILYNHIGPKIRFDILKHILSIVIVFYFPNVFFILGGLASFKMIKFNVIKEKNKKSKK